LKSKTGFKEIAVFSRQNLNLCKVNFVVTSLHLKKTRHLMWVDHSTSAHSRVRSHLRKMKNKLLFVGSGCLFAPTSQRSAESVGVEFRRFILGRMENNGEESIWKTPSKRKYPILEEVCHPLWYLQQNESKNGLCSLRIFLQ